VSSTLRPPHPFPNLTLLLTVFREFSKHTSRKPPLPPRPPLSYQYAGPAGGVLPSRDILLRGPPEPAAIPFVKLLPETEYEYGNARLAASSLDETRVAICREVAAEIPLGRRQNRKGLLYDSSISGFEPASWPHVITTPTTGVGMRYLMLEREGETPSMLYVGYDARAPLRIVTHIDNLVAMHEGCRGGDPMVGTMVGFGRHLRRDGHLANFVTNGVDRDRERVFVAHKMGVLGDVFNQHFVGRGVAYEDMLEMQHHLHQSDVSSKHGLYWAGAKNLGNAAHIDHDASRTYALWVARHGNSTQSRSWWFLLPRHGVAIEIFHGTYISWDARHVEHCTAVPHIYKGDAFLSVACMLPTAAMHVLERGFVARETLRQRSQPCAACSSHVSIFEQLEVGTHVLYRWTPELPVGSMSKRALIRHGKKNVRWVEGKVLRKTNSHVVIKDKYGNRQILLTPHEVGNQVVLQ
jgi:hypothetical protein